MNPAARPGDPPTTAQEKDRADFLIVGAGPGGSTVARLLARAGAKVLLLDAARFPRTKLCAGWVTPEVWRTLELNPASYPGTIQPFASASVEVGEHRYQTNWNRPVSYGIIRREFDAHLLARARSAGARVHDGTRVRHIESMPDQVRVTTDTGDTFAASFVIGAGGHQCPVARAFGGTPEGEAVVITRESETRADAALLRRLTRSYGEPELFAEPDFMGYGWYFTKGDFLNIGVGCMGPTHEIHQRSERLLDRLRKDGRLPPDLVLEPFRGHAYAIRTRSARTSSGDRFALVGDAAGLARPLSGEGIGPAVESATKLARRLLEDPITAASQYHADLIACFGKGPSPAFTHLTRALPPWVLEATARMACRNAWSRKRLLFEGAFGMGPSDSKAWL